MRIRFPWIVACLSCWTLVPVEADIGGITARFVPDEVQPGDLVTLWIELERDTYGEFELDLPAHPQLHLVARERIPPAHINGQFYQGERLQLQALSSGSITLTDISIAMTDSEGTRSVLLPHPTLTVTPFTTSDPITTPEPLPSLDDSPRNPTAIIVSLAVMILGGIILVLLIMMKLSLRTAADSEAEEDPWIPILRAATLSDASLEKLFHRRSQELSPELRQELETFLYTGEKEDDARTKLHQKLRKELLP